jgi:hypothetical protein
VIDGSKDKWKEVSLLDSILCFALGNDKGQRECSRRKFNQYLSMRESVCTACGSAWVERLLKHRGNIREIRDFPSTIVVKNICYPWKSCDELRSELVDNAPQKSLVRRKQILSHYFSLDIFNEKTLPEVILLGLSIIYTQVRLLHCFVLFCFLICYS